ncbi:MAG: lipocalin-like domain-containing protein [Gammaproteobacteria bacterium]
MMIRHPLTIRVQVITIALLVFQLQGLQLFAQDRPLSDNSRKAPLTASPDGFARVLAPRPFHFPADHGAHKEYRSEWWYFTGNLQDAEGRKFGYQLTFFRFAHNPEPIPSLSAWRDNQLYMAHFTVTDVNNQQFHAAERFSRAGLNLAGAERDHYRVWLNDWTAVSTGGEVFPLRLKASQADFSIDLQLNESKPMVLQGNAGMSQKSSQPGNASYYYSFTRLATKGKLTLKDKTFQVSGASWMDREWSTSALSEEQAGWDWFSLQLSDDSEIMYYRLRLKNGSIDPHSSGTLVLNDHGQIPLDGQRVKIQVLDNWTSPHSKITYPAQWRLMIPSQDIRLDIIPLINDQELNLTFRYWEGAVSVYGNKHGHPVSGFGYVELTGY